MRNRIITNDDIKRIKINPVWRAIPKRWGHSFHPMCSYLAMFPPGIPRYFIEQFTKQGDIVLDPFSGRGTSTLEACIAGRVGLGVDLNPLAYLLTSAKVNPPTYETVIERIGVLRSEFRRPNMEDVPAEIRMLYDENVTLPQLVYLKNRFSKWKEKISLVDRFILASLMGIMHGKHRKSGGTSYLSISMPNTFSMSPGYVKNFINANGLIKPEVDVFDNLVLKINRLYRDGLPRQVGRAYLADARKLSEIQDDAIMKRKVKMIFTSPPYLKVVNYGTFNWIRLWLLGEDIKTIDKNLKLDDEHTLPRYVEFLTQVINESEKVLCETGLACLVIGDVEEPGKGNLNLAEYVWNEIRQRTSMRLLGIIEDKLPTSDKVTRIWGKTQGNATKVDRILILYKEKKPRFKFGKTKSDVLQNFTVS